MRPLPSYPRRVPAHMLSTRTPDGGTEAAPNLNSNSWHDFNSEDSLTCSDPEMEEGNTEMASFHPYEFRLRRREQASDESACSADPSMVDMDNFLSSGRQTPPKDFICPITNHLFDDPVTLETGQTYERKAIQEWLERGNSTCPITRHRLQSTELPKTNYVLKRLVASWQEQNHCPTSTRMEEAPVKNPPLITASKPSPSPTNVTNQAAVDGAAVDIRLAISHLCTSEILSESEAAVLQIEQFWRGTSIEREIVTLLSAPAVVNGFVEILFNSVDSQVLRATLFLLCELASREKTVVRTLTRVDSDVACVVALFKKGIMEAAVLVYLLKRSLEGLVDMDMVDALVMGIKKNEGDLYPMVVPSKTAALLLLHGIIREVDEENASIVAGVLVSEHAVEVVVESLKSELVEEKLAAVGILLTCMEKEGKCRNIIADKVELAPILDSFFRLGDGERFEMIHFLSELVKLNRRTFNEQILCIIKDEGAFSMMHTLLNYLQTTLQNQTPIVASLLLQLDILTEPRKMSMYREEAIDALISCLRDADFPTNQIAAAEAILNLQGRFSFSGKSLARAFLLKRAGMNKSYRALMRSEKMGHVLEESEENVEEEKAADAWERKMAFVLVTHEFGLLFEALADGLRSKNSKLSSTCLVSASWLMHMLSVLPDTGIRGAARLCLLKCFISVFKSAKDSDDKALAMLALRSFMHEPEGLQDLTLHMKDILKILRDLKKSSVLAYDMLKLFSKGQDSSVKDLWNHKDLVHVDCSTHGEVLSLIYFKDRIYSGHTDGSIKVWSGSGSLLHPIQETRDHSKAVTSLAISQLGGKLYSGSLDKTVRVWTIEDEHIQCFEVHDMKDQVYSLTVSNTLACFISQGAGVKVFSWNGGSKLLNSSKHVRCLSLVQGKLFCGCHDGSIQEIDLATGTLSTIQAGSKKLLGKANPIYALHFHDGLLYSAGTSLDGAVKIWSTSNYDQVGSLVSTMEVRSMALSAELIYLGCKSGLVEIWSKEKLTRVGTLQTSTGGKVQCMALDRDGEVLVVGTSDGHIQAWGLS